MADTHGHDSHDHSANEEDVVRTPMWLPFVGIGLLLLGAMGTYLWIYPGTMNPPSTENAEAGAGDASAEAGSPAVAAPAPQGQPVRVLRPGLPVPPPH
jgi:hypothetical protein